MALEYEHTQPGYLTGGATGAAALFLARQALKGGPATVVTLPVLALLGGAAVLFSSLTVRIRDGTLRSHFGPGLPAKTVRIQDIAKVQVVENPWYAGWGIRITPRGMLYNVSGLRAVEVTMNDDTRFRLGTDEPEALQRAIEQAMEEA